MTLDNIIKEGLEHIPYFGKIISDKYNANPTIQRFFRYSLLIAIQFWLLRAPLVWFLKEKIGFNYLVADFGVGTLLIITSFIFKHFWIWKNNISTIFEKFGKEVASITVEYWILRAPLTWVLTEKMNIHYILSSFIIGAILTIVLGFLKSEYWIWKGRS